MTLWESGIERQIGEIRGEKKWILSGLAAGFIILLSAGFQGYDRLTTQITDTRIAAVSTGSKIDRLEDKTDALGAKVEAIDAKLDALLKKAPQR